MSPNHQLATGGVKSPSNQQPLLVILLAYYLSGYYYLATRVKMVIPRPWFANSM